MKTSFYPAARSLLTSALILGQALLPDLSYAQVAAPTIPVSTQFSVVGFIQAATLDPTCGAADELCGGSITVNNQRYTVPRNTILQMPAAALTWKQVFTMSPTAATRAGVSGMALQDMLPTGTPNNTYEASVTGNRIRTATGDDHIAGLITLAQHSLQAGAGYINYIDYATGEFHVGGALGSATTGARVKVNDPLGRFSRKWSPDARFTVDEDNPTIRSETGTPMCIPRANPAVADDPWCPQKNRPRDAGSPSGYQMVFTMPRSDAVITPNTPDPRRMVPFEIGDYVNYSGIIVETDPTLIAAWNVTGNVGAYTAPDDPALAYVATDVGLLGVGGLTVAGAAEATIRTRFEGFTSNVNTNPAEPTFIDIFGLDVDCAGTETQRIWGTIDVDPGPPNGAVPGRWRFRPPIVANAKTDPRVVQASTFLPATREMYVSVRGRNGLPMAPLALPTADGGVLMANQYAAPIGEFLFPENAGTGKPIVPNNFDDMPFLANGSGPVNGFGTQVQGTLSPWPGEFVPTAGCTPFIGSNPTANAGATQTVSVSSSVPVTLVGTGVDPNNRPLTFQWTQTAGAAVTLNNANTATANFLPTTVGDLTFRLTVSSTGGSATSTVVVHVVAVAAADNVIPTLVEYRISKQRLTVTVADSITTLPGPRLTMTAYSNLNATGTPGIAAQMTNIGGGVFTIIQVGVAQPKSVKITSDAGGSAIVNVINGGIVKIRL